MIEAPDPGTPRALILITSVNADVAAPERADYCMSKAGLSMWTKTLALRLAPSAIGVFEIRPGIIRTDMTARGAEGHQRLIDGGAVPAGRWGEPADVARVAVALASGAFAFASGTVVNADGGLAIPRM